MSYYVITWNDLMQFLENNQNEWDSRYIEKNMLGSEPEWLKEKRKSDIAYFLNRYYNCDDSIKEKVINRILEVCTKKEILDVLNERYSGFLASSLTDEQYNTLKKEITNYLN